MATVNSYLNFNGNTEEAFNFYKSVFGGKFATLQRFKDLPVGDNMPASDCEKIMHVSLPIGKGTVLMATDALESMGHKVIPGNNYTIAIGAESMDEAKRLFNGLSKGGEVRVPLDKAVWGAYFGMFVDKFGIQWMVNYDQNQHN